MIRIIHIFVTFILLESIFQFQEFSINNQSRKNFFIPAARASVFSKNKKEIQQSDIYVAELSDDLKTRLHQILNNNIPYIRYSVDSNDDNKSFSSHHKRNFISILDSKYQEKIKEENQNNENTTQDSILNNNEDSANEPIIKNYIPYLEKNVNRHSHDHHHQNHNNKEDDNNKINNNSNNKSNMNDGNNINKNKDDNNDNDRKNKKGRKSKLPLPFLNIYRNGRMERNNVELNKNKNKNENENKNENKNKNSTDSNIKTNSTTNGNGNSYNNKNTFYHSIQIKKTELTNSHNTTDSLTSLMKPFDFSVECMDDIEECHYINERLESAGNYISNIFNIYQTITVEVHILPFCTHMGGDNCNMITALTYAPSFVTLNITDQGLYSYPQALAKQLDINDHIKRYSPYDISLYFNTDYLKENRYGNYLLVTAHEIIHGMGFFHLMTTASAAFKMDFPEDRIIPQPVAHNYRTSKGEERAYQGWIPFTVFDRYVVEVAHPDYYIHEGIQEYLEDVQTHKMVSKEEVVEHFETLNISPPVNTYSKYLSQSFKTREAIGFRTYDGEVVTLQTFQEYEPTSSISHIHAPFSCDSALDCYVPKEKLEEVDENYLMYYTIITRPVNDLIHRYSQNCQHGFIGDKIVKIMKTLGWTEKQDLTYFREYSNIILSHEAAESSATLSMTLSLSTYIFFILFSMMMIFY